MPIRKIPRMAPAAPKPYSVLGSVTGSSPISRIAVMAQGSTGAERQGLLRALEVLTCLPVDELERQIEAGS